MSLILNIGNYDLKGETDSKPYMIWRSMIQRCYSENHLKLYPTYKDCFVCEEWLTYSNFKKWFNENYIENYCLDKDLLYHNNNIYSPTTCCFIPHEINTALINKNRKTTDLPNGVTYDKQGTFQVIFKKYGKPKRVGTRYFSLSSACEAYKKAKEEYIKELAEKYFNQNLISKSVYEALLNYYVDITYDKDIIIKKKPCSESKPVIQLDKNNNVINEYRSINEAARQTNYKNNSISLCCRELKKSYNGYIWKFKK